MWYAGDVRCVDAILRSFRIRRTRSRRQNPCGQAEAEERRKEKYLPVSSLHLCEISVLLTFCLQPDSAAGPQWALPHHLCRSKSYNVVV